jgi:hypothetical protein
MFICFPAGGLGMSITIGIVDVLFVQAKTQGSVSASVDLALGLCLLALGALVATERRPPAHARPGGQGPELVGSDAGQPRVGLAFVIGALAGTPGASYILRLTQLVQSKRPGRSAGGRRAPVLPDPVLADARAVTERALVSVAIWSVSCRGGT